MAKLAIGLGGAVVGGLLTGGNPWAIKGGFLLGQFAAAKLGFGDEDEEGLDGPAEFRVIRSAHGADLPTVDGTLRLDGHLTHLVEIKVVESEEKVGGKGLFGGPTQTRTEHFGTFAVSFADCLDLLPGGYGAFLQLRMGIDQELIYDATAGASPTKSDRFRRAEAVRFYTGEEAQEADPTLQAFFGIDETDAMIGTAYVVFVNFPLNGPQLEPVSAVLAMEASEALPFERIEPDVMLLTEKMVFSIDERTGYVVSGGRYNKLDLVGRRLLDRIAVAVDDLPGFSAQPTLDDRGVFWGWDNEPGDDVDFANFDAETGAEVARSLSRVWNNGVIAFAIIPLRGGLLGAVAVGSFGRMIQLDTALNKLRDHNSANPFSLGTYFPASYVLSPETNWTLDGGGDPWFTIEDGTDGYLVRLDPNDGTPVERVTLAGRTGLSLITYEPLTDSLILRDGSTIVRFDLTTRLVDATLGTTLVSGNRNDAAWRVIDGKMYLQEFLTGNAGIYDVTGDEIVRLRQLRPNDWLGTSDNWEAPVYDPINHALIVSQTSGSTPRDYAWLFLDRLQNVPIQLKDVVERRSAQVGLSLTDDIDAASLIEVFPGGLYGARGQVRSYLESLQPPYLFNVVEEFRDADGYKIRYAPRGGAPAVDIPIADLEARPFGRAINAQPKIGRRDPRTAPLLLEMRYKDPAAAWLPGLATDQREAEVSPSQEMRTIDVQHLALDNDFAAQSTETILFLSHINRKTFDFTTDQKYFKYSAGDVVRILGDVAIFTVLIERTRMTAEGVKIWEGVAEDATVYTSTLPGAAGEGIPIQSIEIISVTTFHPLDVALLPGEADELRLLFAGGPSSLSGSWFGYELHRSLSGVEFSPIGFQGVAATLGFALAALPDHANPGVFDRVSVLQVRAISGTFVSITEDQLIVDPTLNGFFLKNGTGWEAGNFIDATLQADGRTWHLTTLVRGAADSENLIAGHIDGDALVVPIKTSLKSVEIALSDLGVERHYRAVTRGLPLGDQVTKSLTATGKSKLPYRGHFLGASESGGDHTVTVARRGRLFNLNLDFGNVVLGELTENYDADLLDDMGDLSLKITTAASPNGSVVTIGANSYTVFVDALDLAGIALPFTLDVYQVGGVDGLTRGTKLSLSIG